MLEFFDQLAQFCDEDVRRQALPRIGMIEVTLEVRPVPSRKICLGGGPAQAGVTPLAGMLPNPERGRKERIELEKVVDVPA